MQNNRRALLEDTGEGIFSSSGLSVPGGISRWFDQVLKAHLLRPHLKDRVGNRMTPFLARRAAPLALFCALLAFPPIALATTSETYTQAETLVRQGQWDQGINLLKRLLEAEPENLKALNLLGIALTGGGDLVAANREFRQAVRVDPRIYPALKNLAINEFTQKDVTAATRALLTGIEG